jgi:hypothetical protein
MCACPERTHTAGGAGIIAPDRTGPGNPGSPTHHATGRSWAANRASKGYAMGKGNNQKSNKEVKKPKKEKVKAAVAAPSANSRAEVVVSGKTVK